MALPQVVQDQLEQAEAALAAAQAQDTGLPGVVTDVSQIPPPAPAPTPVAQPAPTPPTDGWEQRFKTLQGKYNAEIPRLAADNRALESQMVALRSQLDALTAAAKKPPEPEKPAVDPRDVESFGADLMDMVHRYTTNALSAMRAEFGAVVQRFEDRVAALEQTVNGVSAQTSSTLESQFYATLAQLVPDWEAINATERWLTWLAETDPVYGVPRQAALDRAKDNFDSKRVAAIFNQFKATLPTKPDGSLESLVAPNGTGGAQVAMQAPARPYISRKAVDQFYLDVARNRYVGREAEQARINADIELAAAEGRIV